MPRLMGERKERHGKRHCHRLRRAYSHCETGHIRVLLVAWTRGRPHRFDCTFAASSVEQPFQDLRKLLHVVENGVALPQAKFAFPHRQQLLFLPDLAAGIERSGGRVVARIDAQNLMHVFHRIPLQPIQGPR